MSCMAINILSICLFGIDNNKSHFKIPNNYVPHPHMIYFVLNFQFIIINSRQSLWYVLRVSCIYICISLAYRVYEYLMVNNTKCHIFLSTERWEYQIHEHTIHYHCYDCHELNSDSTILSIHVSVLSSNEYQIRVIIITMIIIINNGMPWWCR